MAENRWFVACWTSFFAPTGVVPRTCRQCGALQACCGGGFAALEAGWRSTACRSSNDAIPPVWWRRSRELRGCGRQSADPLGEESPKTTGFAEWVCDLAESIAVAVCWSHVTPEHVPHSLVVHSPACRGINRLTSCESCYTTVLSSNEAKSGRD